MGYMDKMAEYGFIPANHETPVYFPAEIVPLVTPDGGKTNQVAIRRSDNLDLLGYHTTDYKLVTHEAVTEAFDAAIRTAALRTDGMMVCRDTSHQGAKLFLQYVFPDQVIKIGDMDETALRIVGFNSYDGSMAVKFRVGGYRFVCANTSIFGSDIAAASAKHTAGFDISEMAVKLVSAAEAFIAQQALWASWSKTKIKPDQALLVLRAIPGSNPALRDGLMAEVLGTGAKTLWDLYNVLTAWATHTEARNGKNAIANRIAREDRVAKVLDGKVWKELETA